jgi:hypothetical protein
MRAPPPGAPHARGACQGTTALPEATDSQKQQTEGKIMKTKTRIKAGGIAVNHSETLVRASSQATGLKVKTHVKAEGIFMNHNETLVRQRAR